jgi:hypothetical protein
MDEEAHKEFVHQLATRLQQIPEEYHDPKTFNPLPAVVSILQGNPEERNEKLDEIEDHFNSMDTAMNLIVDGNFSNPFFL